MDSLSSELKSRIVETLRLEKIRPEDIKDDAPLFGEGLGLDSIDALELVAMLDQDYGIVIQDRNIADQAFSSISNLAKFVSANRK